MKLLVLSCYSNVIYDEPEDSTGGKINQLATVRSVKKLKEVILEDVKWNYENQLCDFIDNYDGYDDRYDDYKYDFENIYDKPRSYNKCFEQFLSEYHNFELEKELHIPDLKTLEKGKLIEIMDFEDTSDDYWTEYLKYYIIKLS